MSDLLIDALREEFRKHEKTLTDQFDTALRQSQFIILERDSLISELKQEITLLRNMISKLQNEVDVLRFLTKETKSSNS